MKRTRFVQLKSPKTGEWQKIERGTGKIVGSRKKKYAVPVARRRKIKRPPLSAYTKSGLVKQTKRMGIYKSRYNKAELFKAYFDRLGESIRKIKEKNKNNIHIISNRNKWAVKRRNRQRATKIFKDKGDAVSFAINKYSSDIVIHTKDGTIDFIIKMEANGMIQIKLLPMTREMRGFGAMHEIAHLVRNKMFSGKSYAEAMAEIKDEYSQLTEDAAYWMIKSLNK